MSNPTLSVLLPNYNHADFLPRCLDAILNQSFRDFELIIVDDASTDDSVRVIEEYARRDPRIRFYRNPQNRGVVPTLNRALELARGEFAHGAASDDYVLPGYFQDATDLLRKHPQAGLALGLTECVNDNGRTTFVGPEWAAEPCYLSPEALAARITDLGVPGPAIWRRDLFLKTGGYNPELKWHCDWFALQVVAFRHGVCFLPQKATVVRVTDDAYSQVGQKRPATQRPVLQRLLTELAAPQHRDVLGPLGASGAMKQFGPELVRAAALMSNPPAEILEPLRPITLGHAANLLVEPDPEIRGAVAAFLGRFGRAAFPFYRTLGNMLKDPDPVVREGAAAGRRAIRRAVPVGKMLAHQAKWAAGRAARALERFVRPVQHDRLERIETQINQLAYTTHQILCALSVINTNIEKLVIASEARRADADQPGTRSRAA